MATNFLQAALDLIGRPGNAVRGALIDGPGGFGRGLSGESQYDPTQLPGVRDLPDQGLSMGPLNLTPRTVAGFGAGMALDPLSYVGGFGAGHAGELAGEGLGLLDHLSAPEIAHASTLTDMMGPGAQRLRQASIIRGDPLYAGIHPDFVPVEHGGNFRPLSDDSLPGDLVQASTPEQAESAVAHSTGSEAGLRPNIPPPSEPTPVGDQKLAQAQDRLGQTQAELGELNGRAVPARQWLTETSQGTVDNPAQRWEDVLGVPKGTNPESVLPDNTLANKRLMRRPGPESEPDLSQGPGLTSSYNGETVGFSRQEVLNHLAGLQKQIDQVQSLLTGQPGSRFGGDLEQRGMQNFLSDAQARQQMAADPSLLNTEAGNARRSYEDWAAANGKTPRPGLSDNQMNVVRNKTGQQLSREASFQRAPDSRYFNRGTPSVEDEANLPLNERNTRAPHGDPLEEARALRDQEDKFGRKGAGTYQNQDMLGHDDNYRPGGARDTSPPVEHQGGVDREGNPIPEVQRTRSRETGPETVDPVKDQDGRTIRAIPGKPQRPVGDHIQANDTEVLLQALREQVMHGILQRLHQPGNRFSGR